MKAKNRAVLALAVGAALVLPVVGNAAAKAPTKHTCAFKPPLSFHKGNVAVRLFDIAWQREGKDLPARIVMHVACQGPQELSYRDLGLNGPGGEHFTMVRSTGGYNSQVSWQTNTLTFQPDHVHLSPATSLSGKVVLTPPVQDVERIGSYSLADLERAPVVIASARQAVQLYAWQISTKSWWDAPWAADQAGPSPVPKQPFRIMHMAFLTLNWAGGRERNPALGVRLYDQFDKDVAGSAWSGSQSALADPEGNPYLGLHLDEALKVRSMDPKGPAAAAGIRLGDALVKIGSTRVTHAGEAYYSALTGLRVGKPISVVIRRDGRTMTVRLTPAPSPDLPPAGPQRERMLKELRAAAGAHAKGAQPYVWVVDFQVPEDYQPGKIGLVVSQPPPETVIPFRISLITPKGFWR